MDISLTLEGRCVCVSADKHSSSEWEEEEVLQEGTAMQMIEQSMDVGPGSMIGFSSNLTVL